MASDSSKVWSVFSLVAVLGAAAVAKKALNTSWKAATGKNPPANPADPDVDVREAVAWAAVSGALIGLARMLATRRAAGYYAKSTGHLPPGLRKGDDQDAERHPDRPPAGTQQGAPEGAPVVGSGLRRSPRRSSSSRPPAGCGGAPGSSSCR